MFRNFLYSVVLLFAFSLLMTAAEKKEKVHRAVVIDDVTTPSGNSHQMSLNLNPKLEKATVGTATKIGSSFYDYEFNSGGPTMLTYWRGKSYMLFIGKPTAAAPREINYVSYDGVAFKNPSEAVVPATTQSTYFSGIDVFRKGDGDGIAAVGAGWAGSGKSYFARESAPGAGLFTSAIVSPDRDAAVLTLDSTGTILFKDTKGRKDYKIQISTDFGGSWAKAETTVIANGATPGGQTQNTLDVSMFRFPDGSVGIGCTISGIDNLAPTGTATAAQKDSANLIGYFKSTDKGKTWKWNTVSYSGQSDLETDMYNLWSNFDQNDWLADKNGNVHMVANSYPYWYKATATDTISKNSMGVAYWDKTHGFKKLNSFDTKDTMITHVLARESGNAYGCSYPSIAQSADGNVIVCTWSQPSWNGTVLDTNANGIMAYDIFYNYSVDGGATWKGAANLTNTPHVGEFFGTMAEDLEQLSATSFKARIVYLQDVHGPIGDNLNAEDSYYHEWTISTSTGVSKEVGVVSKFSLDQNYPNPFNPSTTIRFTLSQGANTTLKVYNTLGQEVAEVFNEFVDAGAHHVVFDASNLSTGMYLYKLQSGNYVESKKMMLIK